MKVFRSIALSRGHGDLTLPPPQFIFDAHFGIQHAVSFVCRLMPCGSGLRFLRTTCSESK
ncbi:hypothetical protein EDS67_15900 [candidate division KSB1 bacterium]|nr:MAG: hypothetical protein EDS67_15900 [candidate division KSB1 bacterium]MCE7942587.1 hypothetical protein [Chlorobi bacterium CHB1]